MTNYETMKKEYIEPAPLKDQITTFKQSYQEKAKLIQYCKENGTDVSKTIREALLKHIGKQ